MEIFTYFINAWSISVAGRYLINSENKKINRILKQKNSSYNGSQKVLLGIYINKVAVCVFVWDIFLYNYHDYLSLSSNFYHQGENNQFKHILLCHDYPSLSSNMYHQGKTTMVLLFQYPN